MTYTENRTQVFDHMTTTAQAGNYFRLPQQPIVRVLAAVDFGDYVGYIVQAGENPPEQWDVMKHSAELEEQELNRLQGDDWLTQPIGSNPDAIFGKFIEPSDEEMATFPTAENGYHDPNWTNEGCEF